MALMFRRRRRRIGPWIIGVLGLALVLSAAYGVLVGVELTHPPREPMPTNPAYWGMAYRRIRFPSRAGGLLLHGWWIPAQHPSGITVVFAHGYTSNRAGIGIPELAVMRELHLMGANVLAFDFRGEGRSPGSIVSVGEYESGDLVGAVSYASRIAPHDPVAIIGFSMGASVALMAGEADRHVAAVVADSPFAALVPYMNQNLPYWTGLPAFPFNWIVLHAVPLVTGLDPNKVNPLAHTAEFGKRPVLLIAGTKDKTIAPSNSKALYASLRRTDPNAGFWLVRGAEHVESFQLRPIAYLRHVYLILHEVDRNLRAPTGVGF